jgi:hypothetical protein
MIGVRCLRVDNADANQRPLPAVLRAYLPAANPRRWAWPIILAFWTSEQPLLSALLSTPLGVCKAAHVFSETASELLFVTISLVGLTRADTG